MRFALAFGVVAGAVGVASAGVFSASQTIDPWPDDSVASSDLQTLPVDFLGVSTMAAGDATITFDVVGDFNGTDEFLDISVDGFSLGRLFNGTDGDDLFDFGGDDPGSTVLFDGVSATATIALADFAALVADGALSFVVDPTEAQQAPQGVPAGLTITVSYAIPTPGAAGLLAVGGLVAARRRR